MGKTIVELETQIEELEKFIHSRPILKFERLYTLEYTIGRNSARAEILFGHDGDLTSAVIRGRKHCEVMGYRHVMTRPALFDLGNRERLKNKNADWDGSMDVLEEADRLGRPLTGTEIGREIKEIKALPALPAKA